MLRVGIVGYGLMGKAHCYGYRVAPMLRALPVTPVVTVMSGRDAGSGGGRGGRYGVPDTVTDWRELVARDDVDVVDICTPPGTHAQIAAAAAAAGKAVLCEKPLATSYREAAAALAAVRRAGVPNAVGFNYRRLPALALMMRMIDEGAVGAGSAWRATARHLPTRPRTCWRAGLTRRGPPASPRARRRRRCARRWRSRPLRAAG